MNSAQFSRYRANSSMGRLYVGALALCALLAGATRSPEEIINAFESWFEEAGGVHAGFQLIPHNSFRRWAVIAGQDLHEGDLLFHVPLSATMFVLFVYTAVPCTMVRPSAGAQRSSPNLKTRHFGVPCSNKRHLNHS